MPDFRKDSAAPRPTHLNAGNILFLASAAAVATSTSYTVQPEIRVIAADLSASLSTTSAAAGLPILGYMLGLALLVPLVDRVRAYVLVPAQLVALAGALLLTSVANTVIVFGTGLFLSGVCASTGAQMSTLAAKHSPPDRQGRALGCVTAGISAGILFGRMIGGGLTDLVGWRAMLLLVAVACVLCAVVGRAVLPRHIERQSGSWLSGLLSAPRLLRTHPDLLVTSAAGAPLAGRLADRFGARPIVLGGLALALACTLAMTPALGLAPLLLIALALFDDGLFGAQVANQSRVLNIAPLRPAQLNSTYMVIYFVGGSLGAAAGGPIVSSLGWPTAAGVAAAAILIALVLYVPRRRLPLARSAEAGAPAV